MLQDFENNLANFSNYEAILNQLKTQVILCDRSHWGLIELRGSDRLRFLHNQTTNNIQSLKSGQGCDTVFVNSTARTLDLATVYLTDETILVLVSPNRQTLLMEWMDRYLFPMDKVEIKDVSDDYAIFTIIGQKSDELIQKLGGTALMNQPEGHHQLISGEDITLIMAVGSGLKLKGYQLIIPQEKANIIQSKLIELGVISVSEEIWDRLRIYQGRPYPDAELTEDYNPLEAGLWDAISFDKGCYIGQETIARLNTYKGVKQQLLGIKLTQPVEPQTLITLNGEKIGMITSCLDDFALGYIRTKAGGEGLEVLVGKTTGQVVSVPFLNHTYYQAKSEMKQ